MQSISKPGIILGIVLLSGLLSYPQTGKKQLSSNAKKSSVMETNQTAKNKEIIRNLYEDILNNRKLEQIDQLIADEFVSIQGSKGAEGFKQQIQAILKGFPDAHWQVEEIIAEGNKVMIRQYFAGTHLGQFQFYAPTGKKLSNTGIAVYEFDSNGKIAKAQVDTDRLSFLQQMGLVPQDLKELLNKKSSAAIAH